MKKLGFSFDEIGQLSYQDSIDIIDIYIRDLEVENGEEKETIYERTATQDDIDKFFM